MNIKYSARQYMGSGKIMVLTTSYNSLAPWADPGFIDKGVHMYKGCGGFTLVILSHFY